MINFKRVFILFIIWVLLYPYSVHSITNNTTPDQKYIDGEILIKIKGESKINLLNYRLGINIDKVIERLKSDSQIQYVEPNYIYRSAFVPDDTYFTNQWGLANIKAPEAWDIETGEPNIVMAVLDSGVDLDHPDLVNNIWINQDEIAGNGIDDDNNGYIDDYNGWDFIDNNYDSSPQFSDSWTLAAIHHGTAIAGVALATGNNAQGIAGVSWSGKIMSVRVLDSQGVGDTLSVAQGIDYAVANGANIINLSFVGDSNSQSLTDAINRANNAGAIVVAAAGNENVNLNENPRYPVCNENVIGVAASDQSDIKASFSNFGSNCIDVTAPGIDIYTTVVYEPAQNLNQYYSGGWYGTSMASPYVAGVFLILKSYYPNLSSQEIIQTLLQKADNIDEINASYINHLGAGLINVYQCLSTNPIEILIPKNVLVGPAQNMKPEVKILDKDGNELTKFYAYAESFKGGVKIASGDIDGDSEDEIITGTGTGGGPQVRVFEKDGTVISSFFAYGTNFRGGVNVAAGDLDGDGIAEIITGTGTGGGPQVRIFDKKGQARFTPGFFAYGTNFRGGVNVAAGDLDGDGIAEIITGTGTGGGPQVRIFDKNGQARFTPGFFAYDKNFKGGVNVSTGDVDADKKDEIITGTVTGTPHVRILDYNGNKKYQFFAYETGFRGGVFVNTIQGEQE